MSMSLYLQAFNNKQKEYVDRTKIIECFVGVKRDVEKGFDIKYDKLNESWVIIDDDEKISDFAINRPCGDVLFIDIFKVMKLGFICYCPESQFIYSAGGINDDDLPDGMIDAIGEIKNINSHKEMVKH